MFILYIEIQQKIIVFLMGSLLGKHVTRCVYDEPVDKPYRKLQVDQMPIIEIPEKLNYKELLEQYLLEHGKPIKHVKPLKTVMLRFVIPLFALVVMLHSYLYDNTEGRGQYKCKVCSCCFNFKNYYSKAAIVKCPHCSKSLEKIKDFYIFKCRNDECSYYQQKFSPRFL